VSVLVAGSLAATASSEFTVVNVPFANPTHRWAAQRARPRAEPSPVAWGDLHVVNNPDPAAGVSDDGWCVSHRVHRCAFTRSLRASFLADLSSSGNVLLEARYHEVVRLPGKDRGGVVIFSGAQVSQLWSPCVDAGGAKTAASRRARTDGLRTQEVLEPEAEALERRGERPRQGGRAVEALEDVFGRADLSGNIEPLEGKGVGD
jgi:hypothetical protein